MGVAWTAISKVGESLGIHERHLPSHRPVWYLPEKRAVADIWVAVFSRENVKFILNTSGAKNLTCFHGLYAKPGCEHLAPLLVLFLNSTGGREAFARVNRFYGDDLNKLEPKDVEAMSCPDMSTVRSAEAGKIVRKLVQLVPSDFQLRVDACAPPCRSELRTCWSGLRSRHWRSSPALPSPYAAAAKGLHSGR